MLAINKHRIETIAINRQRALVVQRTGWGKSLVYFLATKLLREQGTGPTLLISPLMRNQIEMAKRIGLQAHTINSANRDEWEVVETALKENTCDLLLISPERLSNSHFIQNVLPAMSESIDLFVVDEAHCISDWGHDFRQPIQRIPFHSKNSLARAILEDLRPWLPTDWTIYVQFDSWYVSEQFIKYVRLQSWHVTCGLKHNRKLNGKHIDQLASALRHRRYTHVQVTAADGNKTRYLKTQLGLADFRVQSYQAVGKYLVAVLLTWIYVEHRFLLERSTQIKTYGDLIRRHRDEHATAWLTGALEMMQETGDMQAVLQRYLRLHTASA